MCRAVPDDHDIPLPIVLIQGTKTLELKTEQPRQGGEDYWPSLVKRIRSAMATGASINFNINLKSLTNLNFNLVATAFPTLHLQGKGIIFDLKEDGVIDQSQHRPYLLKLQKGV